MQTRYPSSIREEELKNKIAADFFGAFDCTRIIGNVDFCVSVPATDLPLCDAESVLWAEAKRGADAPLDFALVVVNRVLNGDCNYYLHEVGKIPSEACDHGLTTQSPHCPAPPMPPPRVSRSRAPVCGDGASPLQGDIRSLAHSFFAVNMPDAGIFTSVVADVYDRKGEFIGTKTILAYDDVANIGKWVNSFRHDNDLHLGFMSNGRNDFQNTNLVYFINDRNQLSTPRGWWITPPNLIPMCIFVAVRHSVKATWLNDRDTFLYPNDGWRNDFGFQSDCLVYTLFSDFNVIKSKYGINHWIPFTEEEVGAKDCFASHFMSDWLAGKRRVGDNAPCQGDLFAVARDARPYQDSKLQDSKTPSSESNAARAVLDAGRALWRYYHAQPGANPNASYYDIRLHFQGVKRTATGKEQMNATAADETYNKLLAALRAAHKALAAQIAPKVYEYGFLKR